MLAARDQENLVHGHQALAASKPLNNTTRAAPPKTPANRYPKTPLRVPLHDENAPTGFGKKSVKGKGIETLLTDGKNGSTFDKNAFITPMGPRTRAPLGMKTTNAKAKAFQTPAGQTDKAPEKTQLKPTSTRPLRQKISHAETIKLEIHGDEPDPLVERDVEYCPPKPRELPYESEDFPDGCLDYSIVKGASQRKDFYQRYYNPVDANGLSRKDKQFEEELARSMRATDAKILKAVEDDPCIVRDVPETYPTALRKKASVADRRPASALQPRKPSAPSTKGPATITSRRAASALALAPRPTSSFARGPARTPSNLPLTKKPAPFLRSRKAAAPAPVAPSTMRVASAAAASRSTIGYTRGRSASSVLHTGTFSAPKQQPLKQQLPLLQRVASNHSTASDVTITPARFFQKKEEEEGGRLALAEAFDVDDDEAILALGGGLPECLKREEEEDEEEFEML